MQGRIAVELRLSIAIEIDVIHGFPDTGQISNILHLVLKYLKSFVEKPSRPPTSWNLSRVDEW